MFVGVQFPFGFFAHRRFQVTKGIQPLKLGFDFHVVQVVSIRKKEIEVSNFEVGRDKHSSCWTYLLQHDIENKSACPAINLS